MARKRRPFEVFSMSFLDCMSCGFGAVILFFMIINAQVKETTEDDPTNLMAETRMLEVEVLEGRKNLVLAKNTIEELESERDTAQGRIAQVIALIEELRAELAEYDEDTLAEIERVEKLQTDIKNLEEEVKRLLAQFFLQVQVFRLAEVHHQVAGGARGGQFATGGSKSQGVGGRDVGVLPLHRRDRQTEVAHLHRAIRPHEAVGGLDVPVQDAGALRFGNPEPLFSLAETPVSRFGFDIEWTEVKAGGVAIDAYGEAVRDEAAALGITTLCDQATGGTGQQHPHRLRGGLRGCDRVTGTLHDRYRAAAQRVAEACQIAGHCQGCSRNFPEMSHRVSPLTTTYSSG